METVLRYKRPLIAIAVILIILGGISLYGLRKTPDLVPPNIRKQVSFDIYYPDPAKLPIGYTLQLNSFQIYSQAVIYKVLTVDKKEVVISDQRKPSQSEIQNFYTNYMPLKNDYRTDIGQAEIGAYNNKQKLQTLVSLPTNTNAWLLITAPPDINQQQLQQLLSALKK